MKQCAYCGDSTNLTREHVWPNTILRRMFPKNDPPRKRYHRHTEHLVSGDATVRDVCGSCNNNHLSLLDVYFSKLFENYFSKLVEPDESIDFRYDYHRLVRALIKISYNSARYSGNADSHLLSKLAFYVLNGSHPPLGIKVYLWVLQPTTPTTRHGAVHLTPEMLRSQVFDPNQLPNGIEAIRILGICSYYFHIVVHDPTMQAVEYQKYIHQYQRGFPGITRVNPLGSKITLDPPYIDIGLYELRNSKWNPQFVNAILNS